MALSVLACCSSWVRKNSSSLLSSAAMSPLSYILRRYCERAVWLIPIMGAALAWLMPLSFRNCSTRACRVLLYSLLMIAASLSF